MPTHDFKVTLLQVEYVSGDIGNDWIYDVNVDGGAKHYAEHTLEPGATETLGDVIVHKSVTCSGMQYGFPITIDATEVDTFYNDCGTRAMRISVPCPGTTNFDITVPVDENGGSGTAQLKFYFEAKLR